MEVGQGEHRVTEEAHHGEPVLGTGRPQRLGLSVLHGPHDYQFEPETVGPPMAVGEAIEIRHATLRGAHSMPHPDELADSGYVPLGVMDRRYGSILMWRPAREGVTA